MRAELLRTHEEDTAVRAVSPPSVYPLRSFSRTSLDASEEVSISPHLLPMSGMAVVSRPSPRERNASCETAPARCIQKGGAENGDEKRKWMSIL